MNRFYIATNFAGYTPIFTAAVVRATSHQDAANILNIDLRQKRLVPTFKPSDFRPISKKDLPSFEGATTIFI